MLEMDGVSFTMAAGETLGVVKESGRGKSTIGSAVLRLVEPTSGTVAFRGRKMMSKEPGEPRRIRRHMQIISQDPLSSLNPKIPVGESVKRDEHRVFQTS